VPPAGDRLKERSDLMERKRKAEVVDPERNDLLAVFKELGLKFHGEVGNFMYCPTGEAYITVVSSGVKPEGAEADLFNFEQEALDAWNETIRLLVGENNRDLTVYWRRMPEMLSFKKMKAPQNRWTVYSRFKISPLPIIQSADYNIVSPMTLSELPDIDMRVSQR